MIYSYDGSYQGLLTAVFTAFEYKEYNVKLALDSELQGALFDQIKHISSDTTKSNRVYQGLYKILPPNKAMDFWRAFLSEDPEIRQTIFELIIKSFKNDISILQNYGDERVLRFHQALRKVNRERHRMKAFVRFQKDANGMYVSIVEPDFNVLPLIISFFKNRYADQPWLIYDNKRQYGILYDLHTVTEVTITKEQSKALQHPGQHIEVDATDSLYTKLWQSYFKSTNIEARKNLKLHLQHVPKRYWKYLPEKLDKD
ncbi:TIGR03915 family putative DNA repair protein [Sphingobacterium tabacisoli]|uniref:TIGR03915 family putative DNA repair protein n=1 Tax=Sphingobacterium tabacisoli TaxID=2044855 RepID=A0ABW5L3C9_9SPHI|nr:TIGR03915 family putative DNA repair protein [Sphingobacterium tabacisoli]